MRLLRVGGRGATSLETVCPLSTVALYSLRTRGSPADYLTRGTYGALMDRVRLAELCMATSLFTDLGTGQPTEHGLHACRAAMRLAAALGCDTDVRREVFYVSLLRFLGCTADAHQVGALAGDDEIGFLAGMAPVTMGSPREQIGRMIGLVAASRPIPQRLRALARAVTDPKGKQRLLEAHCEVAVRLADEMGLPTGVVAALGDAFARWDGRGVPADSGTDIPLSVRVSIIARDTELWGREVGADAARRVLEDRRGAAYDPTAVDVALGIGVEALLDNDEDVWDTLLDLEPVPHVRVSGPAQVRALGALGDFADLKLPERSGYSRRIARIVAAAAEAAGLDAAERVVLVRAALVHDVGVVAVPADVWRSQPRPGSSGWEQVRLHPHWSERVLARCSGLGRVATVAGRHHERLDGTGYPAGLTGDIDRASRLLSCAVLYDELRTTGTADVAAELARLVATGALREEDVRAVLGGVGIAAPLLEAVRVADLTEREVEVLSLLARGGTNRQIAEQLSVSVKTVGAHVEHIYVKAGVRSRAAATLFAMQHDLLD